MSARSWTVTALMAAALVGEIPAAQPDLLTKADELTENILISGRVAGIGGATAVAIANVTVTLRRPGVDQATATTKSAEDGSFSFPSAPPNEYEVSFEC